MNSFKFHPVGQGLFYTGSLVHKTYNFVYDCGTKSKKHYLSSSIDAFIREIQEIAGLFYRKNIEKSQIFYGKNIDTGVVIWYYIKQIKK